jgi:hypothetical protein
VFSIARSTFLMYSVMAIFNSSIVWRLFEYTEFFNAPQRKNKSGGERSRDLEGQLVLEMILSANMSSKSAIDICAVFALHSSLLTHYLVQSDCLGQGDTRLTLTPSVIPNSNYFIMVGDRNCLKYCIFVCFCAVIIRCTETF